MRYMRWGYRQFLECPEPMLYRIVEKAEEEARERKRAEAKARMTSGRRR